ncbi:MAG: hypothetical protein QF903_15185 [Planctomycetota bacterium]|nr:hypothetical protein [Planctomycetota bacterium]MDP6990814.1 hypothetical protein [Planctomycetota bacterium]
MSTLGRVLGAAGIVLGWCAGVGAHGWLEGGKESDVLVRPKGRTQLAPKEDSRFQRPHAADVPATPEGVDLNTGDSSTHRFVSGNYWYEVHKDEFPEFFAIS